MLPGAVELREPASRGEALVAAGLRSLLRHSFACWWARR
jgi:hypothetical protein